MTQTDPFGNEPQGAPTAPAVQFSADTLKQASLGTKLAIGGGVAAFLGTFLSWASVNVPAEFAAFAGDTSTSGISSGEGKLSFLAACAVIALSVVQLMKGWAKGMAIGMIAAGAVAVLACFSAWNDISDVDSAFGGVGGVSVDTGIGLYLAMLGAIVMTVGSVLHFKNHKDEAAPAA